MGIDRLRRSGLFPIEALAVISEESMIPLCKKYNIDFCMYKNLPLGEKKNYGLTQAMEKQWDYLIEIGSDDILKTEILEVYKDYFGKDLFGINSTYYLDTTTGDCREHHTSTIFGMGRTISRHVIEKSAAGVEIIAKEDLIAGIRTVPKGQQGFFPIDAAVDLEACGYVTIKSERMYKLWPDHINKSLDNSSTCLMLFEGFIHKRVTSDKPLGIDIKSGENIWPYNKEIGTAVGLDQVLKGLSEEEQKAIFAMIKKNSPHKVETAVIR